jgi:quercetin dioxygenase-like cupin family protein
MSYYHFPEQSKKYRAGNCDNFIGTVKIEKLENSPPESPSQRAVFVEFAPNSYTKLHHHTGDQILYVVKGEGFVQFADGDEILLTIGSRVIIPAGTLHRHGSYPVKGKEFVHLAITKGETHWWTTDPGIHL